MSMNSFHARSRRTQPKPERDRKAVDRPHGMQRADVLLVARALASSRACARRLVEAGRVHADGVRLSKPGQLLPDEVMLTVEAVVQVKSCFTD